MNAVRTGDCPYEQNHNEPSRGSAMTLFPHPGVLQGWQGPLLQDGLMNAGCMGRAEGLRSFLWKILN